MTKQKLRALCFSATFGFAAPAPACGLQPPIQNAGAVAKDGIQVAVLAGHGASPAS